MKFSYFFLELPCTNFFDLNLVLPWIFLQILMRWFIIIPFFREISIVRVKRDSIFLFVDYIHCIQNIQSIINPSLNILKIDFLIKQINRLESTYIRKLLIEFQNLIGNLGTSGLIPFLDLL